MQATFLEAQQHPDGPTLIAIDLNADTADIPTLSDALDSHTWIDVGAHASAWGRPSSDYTCIAPNTLAPTSRDYIFANPQAFDLVRDFYVDHTDLIPTQDVLHISIAVDATIAR